MLVKEEKVIVYSKTFKYPCNNKVFIDESPKIGFSDMNKLQKATQI